MGEPRIQNIEAKKTYRITGIEIFSVGTWNGAPYEIGNLYSLVDAFNALKPGWIPALKLGHDKDQKVAKRSGLPSVGWVERVYVLGDKLMADFDGIPEKIFQLIKKKAYRKVSCEIYLDVGVGEAKYPFVLAAVALLGEELPGVMNLNDILDQYSYLNDGEVFAILEKQDTFKQYSRTFELNHTEDDKMSKTENELALEKQLEEKTTLFSTLEAEKAALAEEKVKLEAANAELIEFKATAEAEKAQLKLEAEEAKRKQIVTEFKAKKLVTAATEPMVVEFVDLLSGGKKEFSFDDVIKKFETLLIQTKEAGSINFDESLFAKSKGGDQDGQDDDEKIQKYMKENKCSYAEAYKAFMKKK